MTAPIIQKARFKAPAKRLYAIYMDPGLHAEVTGGKVVISPEPGSRFSAFDGGLWGHTLHVAPNRLIVQRWRSSNFARADPDSILAMTFSDQGDTGVVDLVHVNVPGQDHAGVKQGWPDYYYWKPLRAWLAARAKASGGKRKS